mmetsp:Transcript_56782/g.149582  ORF Transcript_56782/g.149582 Transcript_56782/m.149582 type:complete len:191 (-) Transcript_56782:924-1496(-)
MERLEASAVADWSLECIHRNPSSSASIFHPCSPASSGSVGPYFTNAFILPHSVRDSRILPTNGHSGRVKGSALIFVSCELTREIFGPDSTSSMGKNLEAVEELLQQKSHISCKKSTQILSKAKFLQSDGTHCIYFGCNHRHQPSIKKINDLLCWYFLNCVLSIRSQSGVNSISYQLANRINTFNNGCPQS